MGQFKPMVKMETTEPSVILKLKKGGHVNMKKGGMAEGGHKKMAGGGAMEMLGMTPAFVGRPAVNAPVKSPGKPSMAKRRKAMQAKKPAMSKKPSMPMPEPKGRAQSLLKQFALRLLVLLWLQGICLPARASVLATRMVEMWAIKACKKLTKSKTLLR